MVFQLWFARFLGDQPFEAGPGPGEDFAGDFIARRTSGAVRDGGSTAGAPNEDSLQSKIQRRQTDPERGLRHREQGTEELIALSGVPAGSRSVPDGREMRSANQRRYRQRGAFSGTTTVPPDGAAVCEKDGGRPGLFRKC